MINKREYHFTPVGTAEPGCFLQVPDYGNPEKGFGNPRGLWKVDLTVPSAQAQPLIDKIAAAHEVNYKALVAEFEKNPPVAQRGKKLAKPYEGEMPFFRGNDTSVTFRFKGYASDFASDAHRHIPLPLNVVDAKGRSIDDVPAIAGGSKLKVQFFMFPYGWSNVAGASVKLTLKSVMLVELVEEHEANEWENEVVEE